MREWFLSTELMGLDTMPGSTAGISQKARREHWKSRKAKGGGRSLEFHLSNFTTEVQHQLYNEEHGPTSYKEWKIEMMLFYSGAVESRDIQEIVMMDKLEEEHVQQGALGEEGYDKQYADMLAGKHIREEPRPIKYNVEMSSILEFDVQAAAGAGSLVCSEHATGRYTIPTQSLTELGLKQEYTAIVFCSGDSMESLMSDGDRIIVDVREQPTPVTNGIYVIRIDDAVYVKRLKWNILEHSYTVESENKDHDDFVLAGENLERLKVIGKAKLVMKSL